MKKEEDRWVLFMERGGVSLGRRRNLITFIKKLQGERVKEEARDH